MALPPPYLALVAALRETPRSADDRLWARDLVKHLEAHGLAVGPAWAFNQRRIPEGVRADPTAIRVGDVISGLDAYRYLPIGSVVGWTGDRHPETRIRKRMHVERSDFRHGPGWAPAVSSSPREMYEVLYLPTGPIAIEESA